MNLRWEQVESARHHPEAWVFLLDSTEYSDILFMKLFELIGKNLKNTMLTN